MARKPYHFKPIDWGHALARGLAGYWSLYEGVGGDATPINDAAWALPGRITDPDANTSWRSAIGGGINEYGLDFGSVNSLSRIEFPSIPGNHPAAFSGLERYSYVVRCGYVQGSNPSNDTPIFVKGLSQRGQSGHALGLFSGLGYLFANASFGGDSGPGWLNNNDPYQHLVAVRERDVGPTSFYRNGELFKAATGSLALPPEDIMTPGAIGGPPEGKVGPSFLGTIFNLQLYDHALTAADVLALYQDDYAVLAEPDFVPWFRSEAGEPPPADINLDATLPGDSSVDATLTVEPSPTQALTATLPGDSSIDATLTVEVGGEIALDATLDGDSSLSATLTVEPSPTEALSATLPGDSSIDATLTVTPSPTQALTATLDGDSSITATLVSEAPDVRQLIATLPGEADITATLTLEPSTPVALDATLDGDSNITAMLMVEAPGVKQLMGILPGDSSVDATLTLQPSQEIALSATLAGDSDINATLTVEPAVVVPLSATLDGDSSITATLVVQAPGEILVSARLQADSAIVATLTTVVEGLPIICDPSIESCTPVRTVEGTGSSGVT